MTNFGQVVLKCQDTAKVPATAEICGATGIRRFF